MGVGTFSEKDHCGGMKGMSVSTNFRFNLDGACEEKLSSRRGRLTGGCEGGGLGGEENGFGVRLGLLVLAIKQQSRGNR